ncbi:MAG: serine/threonine protein kinase, partial [Planctomycetes bacterium]|nr:serine/threonine protein kinase [Planctomycetota bacterium]
TAAISQRNEHIVRVYDDFGKVPGLGHYYVMEYLEGYPLDDLIISPEGLPSIEDTFHIMLQLCEALSTAHEANVIHRDLKPDNIFIIQRGNDPMFVKVMDFGIAKTKSQKITESAEKGIGTPLYMSPEQFLWKAVDHRTDIYMMGLILYELLTGETPFVTPEQYETITFIELA